MGGVFRPIAQMAAQILSAIANICGPDETQIQILNNSNEMLEIMRQARGAQGFRCARWKPNVRQHIDEHGMFGHMRAEPVRFYMFPRGQPASMSVTFSEYI